MVKSLAISGPHAEANARVSAAVAEQGPRLRAFVRRRVADLAEVDDIVQDAFVELVSAHRLIQPVTHAAAWLRRVARNRIIDRFRQRSRDGQVIDGAASRDAAEGRTPDSAGPDAVYQRDVLAEELVAALDELPPDQRAVFVAHELDGRSFKDLCAETGTPVNTLLSRKHAAVLHLRSRLKDIHAAMAD